MVLCDFHENFVSFVLSFSILLQDGTSTELDQSEVFVYISLEYFFLVSFTLGNRAIGDFSSIWHIETEMETRFSMANY